LYIALCYNYFMNARNFLQCYTLMLDEAKADNNILGLILAGSRARDMHNSNSDCDIYIIFKDVITSQMIDSYYKLYNAKYGRDLNLDISNKALQKISEFAHYAELETTFYYDRYNLVHAKLEFDKTNGIVKKLLHKIGRLTEKEKTSIVHENLGYYITLVYRSVRSYEDGRRTAASLDAAESVQYLLTLLFAFADRVRPFNKYLEWELANHPLELLPWKPREFITILEMILKQTDMRMQQAIYMAIENLARRQGFGYAYDSWGVPSSKLEHIKQIGFEDSLGIE
jgi:predicted nucleotidyltransferase